MDRIKTGDFLKTLRTGKGLTQKEAGRRLGVSDKTVSRWERGEILPDLEALAAIARFYNVSEAEIVLGDRLPPAVRKGHNGSYTLARFLKEGCIMLIVALGANVFLPVFLGPKDRPVPAVVAVGVILTIRGLLGYRWLSQHSEAVNNWYDDKLGKDEGD